MSRSKGGKVGRPRKLPHQFVAYTMTYLGINDDELSFVFRGTTMEMLAEVFRFLCSGKGNGIARGFRLTEEHDWVYRHGFGFRMIAARLIRPNLHFTNTDDMRLLIESRLKASIDGHVDYYDPETFLNLENGKQFWKRRRKEEKEAKDNNK